MISVSVISEPNMSIVYQYLYSNKKTKVYMIKNHFLSSFLLVGIDTVKFITVYSFCIGIDGV
jgi:hypothetical protein